MNLANSEVVKLELNWRTYPRWFFSILGSVRFLALQLFTKVFHQNSFVGMASILDRAFAGESIFDSVSGHIVVYRFFDDVRLAPLIARFPHISRKYFSPYLARQFEKVARRGLLLDHYDFIHKTLVDDIYGQITSERYVLWQSGFCSLVITVSDHHQEGDLSVLFLRSEKIIFIISFSIVKAVRLGLPVGHTLVIGRVQGSRNAFDQIRLCTQECLDIVPAHLLMTAVQAIAACMNIKTIACASNAEQLAKANGRYAFNFDYDAFFKIWPSKPTGTGFFVLTVPQPEKPLLSIKSSHRRRALKKRKFKAALASVVTDSFQNLLKKT